jgi:hypothetical protein
MVDPETTDSLAGTRSAAPRTGATTVPPSLAKV